MRRRKSSPLFSNLYTPIVMRYLLSTFLIFCFCAVNAQLTDSTAADQKAPFSLKTAQKYWKFSPLDIYSVVPTIGTDVEVKVSERFAFQVGLGVAPTFFQFMTNDDLGGYDRMGGYKVRVEGRIYMPVKTNRYLALGLSVRHLIIRDEVAIGMEPFTTQWGGTDFAYFQDTEMLFNRINTNLDLKYGFQKVKPGGLVLDFYAGLSIRSIQVRSNSEIPDGGDFPLRGGGIWTLTKNHSLNYPTPIVGFKIGFAQKRK
ncbi:MAG: hypothetical protein ACI8ZM_001164 [Crocinitomix sp.]|jgi:hypothetical protein